jgi:hypothetical protein
VDLRDPLGVLAAAYHFADDSDLDDFTLVVNEICERTGISTDGFPEGDWGAVAKVVGFLAFNKPSMRRAVQGHLPPKEGSGMDGEIGGDCLPRDRR